jgi:stalled ribosome rescue protein Dom34
MKLAKVPRMSSLHTAVWIDHQEARIFPIEDETIDSTTIRPRRHIRRHPTQTAERRHPADEQHFYHEVATALDDAREVLVVGPGPAKLEFIKHVHKREHALEPKIIGVETVDHPTDGQIVDFARRYFRAADRMLGNAR